MNKLYGTIAGGAAGFIIGITGLLLLRAEAGSTRCCPYAVNDNNNDNPAHYRCRDRILHAGKYHETTHNLTATQNNEQNENHRCDSAGNYRGGGAGIPHGRRYRLLCGTYHGNECQWLEHHPELRRMGQQHSRTGSVLPRFLPLLTCQRRQCTGRQPWTARVRAERNT